MLRRCLATLASLLASHAAQAGNCEAIRAQIEAKVRASGVREFALTIVEADAKGVAGKVVGSCDLGSKKIVYSPSASSGASPSRPRPVEERIVTECKDGSVSLGGDCKK